MTSTGAMILDDRVKVNELNHYFVVSKRLEETYKNIP